MFEKPRSPPFPVVLVGRLLRSDSGTWLRADCDEGPTLEGQLRPYAIALVNSVSSVRSASQLAGDWKHFDFAAKLRGIRIDDPLAKAPLAAVYG